MMMMMMMKVVLIMMVMMLIMMVMVMVVLVRGLSVGSDCRADGDDDTHTWPFCQFSLSYSFSIVIPSCP